MDGNPLGNFREDEKNIAGRRQLETPSVPLQNKIVGMCLNIYQRSSLTQRCLYILKNFLQLFFFTSYEFFWVSNTSDQVTKGWGWKYNWYNCDYNYFLNGKLKMCSFPSVSECLIAVCDHSLPENLHIWRVLLSL